MSDDLADRLFLGGLVLAALLIGVAAVTAAVNGFEGVSWLTALGKWALVIVLAAMVVLLGLALIVFGGWLFTLVTDWGIGRIKESPTAPVLLPAILAALTSVLLGLAKDVLSDDPVVRWLVGVAVAVITLIGAVFAYLGLSRAVTFAALIVLLIPAAILVVAGFTTPWWSDYRALTTRDQILIGAGLLAYAASVVSALLVAWHGHRRRRSPSEATST